jgi:pimeloyl-ACP methyl ester carboxylesterase
MNRIFLKNASLPQKPFCHPFRLAVNAHTKPEVTWLTNTAQSGARLYWGYLGKGYFNAKGVNIPVAVSVFPDGLYPAPQSWVEQAYPKLIHYNKLPKSGHFAAWEQPQLFSEEVRAGFRSLRS